MGGPRLFDLLSFPRVSLPGLWGGEGGEEALSCTLSCGTSTCIELPDRGPRGPTRPCLGTAGVQERPSLVSVRNEKRLLEPCLLATYMLPYALNLQPAGLDMWIHETVFNCEALHYVTTLAGRRLPLPDISSSNSHVRAAAQRCAVNYVPQVGVSSAARVKAWLRGHWPFSECGDGPHLRASSRSRSGSVGAHLGQEPAMQTRVS